MNKKLALLAFGLFSLSGAAQAALQGRDLNGSADSFEAYYDTNLNITWLADANYAKTSGYDADGLMNWYEATAWAANLSFTDGVNTYDNWRLPTTLLQDASCSESSYGLSTGNNCTGSEMGNLIHNELSANGGPVVSTYGGWAASRTDNYYLFSNIQYNAYLSGTEFPLDPTYSAYYFDMRSNTQGDIGKVHRVNAWAVSPGDVAAIPEPEAYTMMLAGLGLLGFANHRRKQKQARGIN